MPKCIDCGKPISPDPYCDECSHTPVSNECEEVIVWEDPDGSESVIAACMIGIFTFILGIALGVCI